MYLNLLTCWSDSDFYLFLLYVTQQVFLCKCPAMFFLIADHSLSGMV